MQNKRGIALLSPFLIHCLVCQVAPVLISFLTSSLFLKAEILQNHTLSFLFLELPSLKSGLNVSTPFFSRILIRKIFSKSMSNYIPLYLSFPSFPCPRLASRSAARVVWGRRLIIPGRGSLKLWGINEHLAGWSWQGANPSFNHLDRK